MRNTSLAHPNGRLEDVMYSHAVAWIDHRAAHVVSFSMDGHTSAHITSKRPDRRLHRKSGIPGAGRAPADMVFFDEVSRALSGAREILLVGPGTAKNEFREHLDEHHPDVARMVVGVEPADHPSEGQLLAFARQYFKRIDQLGTS